MKPGSLTPIRGHFEGPKALLHHIADDDEIAELVIVTVRKDGTAGRAHVKMSRANMAYASVMLSEWCREDEY